MSEEKRYVTIRKYAELCRVNIHAIYPRIHKSMDGKYSPEDPIYLEVTYLPDVEGEFIDTERFPPKRFNSGRKVVKKK